MSWPRQIIKHEVKLMKTRNRKSGYSTNTANEYVDNKQGIYCLSIVLPSYMSLVQFDNLQACEVGFNVYFKADNVKEVK